MLGVVQLINVRDDPYGTFTRVDLEVVKSFCSIVAMAVERAVTYDDLRHNFGAILELSEKVAVNSLPDCE